MSNRSNREAMLDLIETLPKECPVCGSDWYDIAATKDKDRPSQLYYIAEAKYGCDAHIRACSHTENRDKWERKCGSAQKVALKMIEKHGRPE